MERQVQQLFAIKRFSELTSHGWLRIPEANNVDAPLFYNTF